MPTQIITLPSGTTVTTQDHQEGHNPEVHCERCGQQCTITFQPGGGDYINMSGRRRDIWTIRGPGPHRGPGYSSTLDDAIQCADNRIQRELDLLAQRNQQQQQQQETANASRQRAHREVELIFKSTPAAG